MISVLIFLISLTVPSTVLSDDSIVFTSYGPVQGVVADTYRAFLGIPFMAPPVGNLRWMPPEPPQSWGPSPLKTTQFKPGCPQTCILPPFTCPDTQSEDCMYLNIYTPPVTNSTGLLPVMAFIHGGHFEQGSSGTDLYDSRVIVSTGNVIVVTINYRLGFLGWLAVSNAQIFGNFGFLDQIMGLQFIQKNIKAFGGDPSKVTLFGQSAGGTSIRAHLISPLSTGLFSQIIVQSDPYSLPMRDLSDATGFGSDYAKQIGCNPSDPNLLTCLQSKSVNDVVNAQVVTEKELNLRRPIEMFLPFTPVVDGSVVPMHIMDALAAGKFTKVPMIVGSVSEDALLFIYKAVNSSLNTVKYEAIVAAIFLQDAITVSAEYPPKLIGDKRPELSIMATDYIFDCVTRYISSQIYKNTKSPLYIYQWDHMLSFDGWGPLYPYCVGHVCHGSELPYLFNPPALKKVANFTPDEVVLSNSIITYWTNFAKTGNPNNNNNDPPRNPELLQKQDKVQQLIQWPAWTPQTLQSIRFATPANTIVSGLQKTYCDFWDGIGYHHGW